MIFALAWEKEYSQLKKNTRKKRNAYFCSALNDGSNGVKRSKKSLKTREEISLQEE